MRYQDLDFRKIQDELMLFWLMDDFEITNEMLWRIPATPSKMMN